MNYCIDLILGIAFCIYIFFHFPDSRLSVLKGSHFYFCFLTLVKTENKKVLCQCIKVPEKTQSLDSCRFTNLLNESLRCHEGSFLKE